MICSDSRRTRETLELILPALGDFATVELETALYGASAAWMFERLRSLPETVGSVMLIGHNPGLHELALTLALEPAAFEGKFPTGALASLEPPGSWNELSRGGARLAGYVVPRRLG